MSYSPYTKMKQITTELSGGRKHFAYRDPFIVLSCFTQKITQGENPYTAAVSIFGSDTMWMIIGDINEPGDPFYWEGGQEMVLPEAVVSNQYEKSNIWMD